MTPLERLRAAAWAPSGHGDIDVVDLALAEQVVTELQDQLAEAHSDLTRMEVAIVEARAEVERLRGALAAVAITCAMGVDCSIPDDCAAALEKESTDG